MEQWTVSKLEAFLVLAIPAMITAIVGIALSLAVQLFIPGIIAKIIGYIVFAAWVISNTAYTIWFLFWCKVK